MRTDRDGERLTPCGLDRVSRGGARIRDGNRILAGRARWLYRGARVVALLDLAFLAGFPLTFLMLAGNLAGNSPDTDWVWRALQAVGLLGVLGTAVVIAEFVTALRDPARPWWTKASDGLLAVVALATVWFAFSQHLLSLGLKY